MSGDYNTWIDLIYLTSTSGDPDVQERRVQPTSSPRGAGRSRGHFESSSTKIQWKIHLSGNKSFVSEKGQSLNPTKSHATQRNPGPNPASSDCPRRRSPSASIDSQEEVPQSQQSQEVTQSQSASIASHEDIQGTQER